MKEYPESSKAMDLIAEHRLRTLHASAAWRSKQDAVSKVASLGSKIEHVLEVGLEGAPSLDSTHADASFFLHSTLFIAAIAGQNLALFSMSLNGIGLLVSDTVVNSAMLCSVMESSTTLGEDGASSDCLK